MHLDGYYANSLLLGTFKIKQIVTLLTELTFRDLLLYCFLLLLCQKRTEKVKVKDLPRLT